MRSTSLVLVVVGILIAILGLVNHFVLNPPMNVFPHTSIALIVLGVIVLVIGGAMMMTGGRSAS